MNGETVLTGCENYGKSEYKNCTVENFNDVVIRQDAIDNVKNTLIKINK